MLVALMTFPNWTDLTLHHYLAIGGGVVVVLALVLYFTPVSRLKVPGIVLGIVGGLVAGSGLGVMAMAAFGYHWERQGATSGDNSPPPGMPPGGGGPPGMMMAMMGGGGRGPNSKTQLASLITKLDLLTHKPLAVTLNAEQKKKVRELIQKLEEKKEVSEDEAKAKLDDLRKVLNDDQRKTLEAAGYRWPGQGGGRRGGPPAPPPPNPFSEGENNQHLKSLRGQLEDKKTE